MEKRIAGRKVAIAVTSEVIARGLLHAVEELENIDVCAMAPDAMDAEHLWEKDWLDLMLLDIEMIDRFGKKIKESRTFPRVLLFAPGRCPPRDLECAKGCACGYVGLDTPMEPLKTFVERVARCPLRNARYTQCAECPAQKTLVSPKLPMTSREQEVFELMSRHHGNRYIADHLGISIKTVESHRVSIKRKLGCKTNSELVEAAAVWRRGLS